MRVSDHVSEDAQGAYARLAGLMYFVVLGFDIAGLVIASSIAGSGNFVQTSHQIAASETLYRVALCCSLIGSLSTIPLAVGLYVALKPFDGNLAMAALLFRAGEAAIGGMGVISSFAVLQMRLASTHVSVFGPDQLGQLTKLNSGGTEVPAIFFSLGSTIFFYLFFRSGYIPRILAAWGIFASLLYAAVWFQDLILPQFSATVALGSVPILIAELSTGSWLLFRGIKTH